MPTTFVGYTLNQWTSDGATTGHTTQAAIAGVQDGDQLLLVQFADQGVAPMPLPAGWADGFSYHGSPTPPVSMRFCSRRAQSEPDHYDFGGYNWLMLAYRGAALDVIGALNQEQVLSRPQPATALSINVGGGLVLGLWWWRTGASLSSLQLPAGYVQRVAWNDGPFTLGGDNTILVGDKTVTAGATGDQTAYQGGTSAEEDHSWAFQLGLKPTARGLTFWM